MKILIEESELEQIKQQRDKYRQDYKRIKVRYNHIISLVKDVNWLFKRLKKLGWSVRPVRFEKQQGVEI